MSENTCVRLLKTLSSPLEHISEESVADFTGQLLRAGAIFVMGAGRSGLTGKFFAMRLMHLGKRAHVVGDTTTPAISRADLLVCISGSGNTVSVVHAATIAKQKGASVAAITSDPASRLAGLSDCVVRIDSALLPGTCAELFGGNNGGAEGLNVIPMGTLFELCALLVLESIIAGLILECVIPESEMKQRHANME